MIHTVPSPMDEAQARRSFPTYAEVLRVGGASVAMGKTAANVEDGRLFAALRLAAAGMVKTAEEKEPSPFYLQDAVGRPPDYKNFPLGTEPLPADGVYTIKAGDNPFKLQHRFGISKESLYEANPGMDDATATKWQIGKKIRLPRQTLRQQLSKDGFDPESTRDMDPDLLNKMTYVESSFKRFAHNKAGNAYGELQIRQPMLDQAKKWDNRLKDWTLEDMFDPEKARFVRQTFHNGRQLDYQYQKGEPTPDPMFVRWWYKSGDPYSEEATQYLNRVNAADRRPGYRDALEMYLMEQN